jgi:hypothetical protein
VTIRAHAGRFELLGVHRFRPRFHYCKFCNSGSGSLAVVVEAGGGGSFFVAFDGGSGLAFGGAGEDGGDFGGGQFGLGFDGEDIGFELGNGFDAGDEGIDVLGEGEAEALFDLGDFVAGDGAHGVGLHGEDAEAHFAYLGEDVGDEAFVVGVDQIDGHLDGFPAVEAAKEFEVDGGVVVAGEADVADFALFFWPG